MERKFSNIDRQASLPAGSQMPRYVDVNVCRLGLMYCPGIYDKHDFHVAQLADVRSMWHALLLRPDIRYCRHHLQIEMIH